MLGCAHDCTEAHPSHRVALFSEGGMPDREMAMPVRRKVHKYEAFFLDLTGNIPWEELPNRGVFAVEEFGSPWLRHRFFTVRGVEKLRDTLETYTSKRMLPNPSHVYVLTAACEEDLPDRDREEILRVVLSGVERIKGWGDKEALRKVRNALERKEEKPGVVAIAENKRWLIDLLAELASGKSLKESVQKPWKPASASACLSRFCWDFYLDCALFRAESSERWTDPRVAKLLNERHGFRLLDETLHDQDLSAAEEAYRRGKRQVPEIDWPDARLIGPQQMG
jgi:hypothetical protein